MLLRDFLQCGGQIKVYDAQTASFDALEPGAGLKLFAYSITETAAAAGVIRFYNGQGVGAELAENRVRTQAVAASTTEAHAVVPDIDKGMPIDDGLRLAISAGTHDIELYYMHGDAGPEPVT